MTGPRDGRDDEDDDDPVHIEVRHRPADGELAHRHPGDDRDDDNDD